MLIGPKIDEYNTIFCNDVLYVIQLQIAVTGLDNLKYYEYSNTLQDLFLD